MFVETHPWTEHIGIALTSLLSGAAGWDRLKGWLTRVADAMPPLGPNATFKEKWAWSLMAGFRTKGA